MRSRAGPVSGSRRSTRRSTQKLKEFIPRPRGRSRRRELVIYKARDDVAAEMRRLDGVARAARPAGRGAGLSTSTQKLTTEVGAVGSRTGGKKSSYRRDGAPGGREETSTARGRTRDWGLHFGRSSWIHS
ncbi:hypothetical protein EVAR_39183_1 [Eumeta japonica]|uniref:Uncharacterized protein n=1 Tax=Eumeta variegata TaxID=151549 RepID=A0A4C1VQ88_EUMVA|nr:hypothetical protein EVAR_39183_1 [Eumeta japonica]